MRCHICDRLLDEPRYNSDHEDWDPCDPCMAVIHDTLSSYPGGKDHASADEADLPSDPTYEGLYPPTYDPFETE